MPRRSERAHAYKETTLQQLRSFFETARLGSMSAAADELKLSHPTVWQQVHALERELGVQLVEPHGRGCRLTESGQLLVRLASPIVLGAHSLRTRFQEARAAIRPSLTVVATPRVVAEDLPPCMSSFQRLHPEADLTIRELSEREAWEELKSGRADLGVLPTLSEHPDQPWEDNPWLEGEPAYQLDRVLITPKDHPLAARRRVTPKDLAGQPLLNSVLGLVEPEIVAQLGRLGAFRPCRFRVDAQFTSTSRRYVELGFGIALVSRSPLQPPNPNLHERVMSEFFGRVMVYFVRPKGIPPRNVVLGFQAAVRSALSPSERRGARRNRVSE